MTKVISLASVRAGVTVQPAAQFVPNVNKPPAGHSVGAVERQAHIENALNMALYFIRQPGNEKANVWAATARANRALTLLKQSGTDGRAE